MLIRCPACNADPKLMPDCGKCSGSGTINVKDPPKKR